MVQENQRRPPINISWLMVSLFLVNLLISSGLHAWQKNIRFENITTEQGLPDAVFNNMAAQDKYGFMWFATSNGLVKYDGYRFTVYKNSPDNPDLLLSNYAAVVYIDRQDVIWLGTSLGLSRFNRDQETFTHFSHDPNDPESLGKDFVLAIFEDHKGILWVGYGNSGAKPVTLSRFDRRSGRFEHYRHDPDDSHTLPAGIVRSFYEDRSGVLWVGTYARNGVADLAWFDRESNTFNRVFTCNARQSQCAQPVTDTDRPPDFRIGGMLEDRLGNFWISGSGNGLIKYVRESNTYAFYACGPENPGSLEDTGNKNMSGNIVEDSSGRLWFHDRYKGLTRFDPVTGVFSHYRNDPSDPNSIIADSYGPFTLYRDRNSTIWVSGFDNGISKFDPGNLAFGRYKHDPNDLNSLSSNDIFAMAEDHAGLLWIGHDGAGLDKIDRAAGTVTVYRHDPDNPASLHSNSISDLHVDRSGVLWVGTRSGLGRFDRVTGTFKHYPLDSAVNNPEYFIGEDSNGFLWMGRAKSVIRFDLDSGDFTLFRPDPGQSDAIQGEQFFRGVITADDTVWVGGSSGINRFDQDTQSFAHYFHDPKIPGSIRQGPVMVIIQGQKGNFWIGTMTGLDRFDPASGIFEHITDMNGIPVGSVSTIALDGKSNLWLNDAQNRRLWKFNPATDESESYLQDVISSYESHNILFSSSGELMVAGRGGINIFNPDELPDYKQDPAVVMTDFLLQNKPVPVSGAELKTPLSKYINGTSEITLTYKDYLFSFEFAAPGYKNPKGLRYAYMLEGFDEDWIETDYNNRHATYTNVPPGDYVLRVKAAGTDRQWSGNNTSIRLNILPPWWQTWWAYSVYAIAFFLALFAFIRLRTLSLTRRAALLKKTVKARTVQIREHEQKIQHQAEDLEELLHLKEKLITNISHEFRTPLTLIQGPVKRMLKRTEDQEILSHLQMVKRNSQRLLRLVDQLLGLARLGGEGALPRSTLPLTTTAQSVTESFRVLAEEKDLKLTMEPGDELWVSCAPDALDKILLNLLSNAIKYTPAGGQITVSTSLNQDDMVELSISDTGVGIPEQDQQAVFERFHRVDDCGEAVPGAGIGLALVKELVEAYGGRIQLESKPGEGTTVVVSLPRCTLVPGTQATAQPPVNIEAVELEVESLTRLDAVPGSVIGTDADSNPSILIVEDNVDMQNYLVELLSDAYHCDRACDGQQALDRAFEHIPDLVLLDVMMPKLDGFQVSHALKEDERTSHIPIVMLTARGDRESRMEGWQEKVDDYLTKPFDDDELKLRIANLLEIRDILKSRFSCYFFEEGKPGQVFNEKENGFMEKLERVLDGHHADPEFNLTGMARQMYMSTRQLQRKLKAITGHNPAEFLRSYRLKKARELLRTGIQVGVTADAVGFSSPAYFTSCFKAQFAQTPSDYQQGLH